MRNFETSLTSRSADNKDYAQAAEMLWVSHKNEEIMFHVEQWRLLDFQSLECSTWNMYILCGNYTTK